MGVTLRAKKGTWKGVTRYERSAAKRQGREPVEVELQVVDVIHMGRKNTPNLRLWGGADIEILESLIEKAIKEPKKIQGLIKSWKDHLAANAKVKSTTTEKTAEGEEI